MTRPVEEQLTPLQRFRLMFPRDQMRWDTPPRDWNITIINAVRELDRKVNG